MNGTTNPSTSEGNPLVKEGVKTEGAEPATTKETAAKVTDEANDNTGATGPAAQDNPAAPVTEASAQPEAKDPAAPVTETPASQPDAQKPAAVQAAAPVFEDLEPKSVTEIAFLAAGMDHLNTGVRGLEAAHEAALKLRKDYEKATKKHRNIKLAALAAESLLMAYYGYGAIEHYTGLKGSTEAIVANSAVSAGISGTRAGVQYGLMKRGEEAFKEGNKTRGMTFVGVGLSLALINALFVAVGFANKYVTQEQEAASHKLNEMAGQEQQVHADKDAATQRITHEIDELDKKIAALRSGAGDPRIAAIEDQMKRVANEIDAIRNNPNFNDGKETEWDRVARVDMAKKSDLLNKLETQKEDYLHNAAGNLTPEQTKMMEANTARRATLDEEIRQLDQRFAPQLDALKTGRKLWEAKLGGAAEATGGFQALYKDPTILIEALANVAAISVANWWAATEGYKQEVVSRILTGDAEDPWAKKEKPVSKNPPRTFMGYDFAAESVDHMHNEPQLNALLKTLGNPEAMRVEMKAEISRQHSKMVNVLQEQSGQIGAEEYKERLGNLNNAYQRAMKLANDEDTTTEIRRVLKAALPAGATAPGQEIPTFKNPNDPAFKALPNGAPFKTKDGQLRVKT